MFKNNRQVILYIRSLVLFFKYKSIDIFNEIVKKLRTIYVKEGKML